MQGVMPGLWAGHPRLPYPIASKNVDGRDKPGHDEAVTP